MARPRRCFRRSEAILRRMACTLRFTCYSSAQWSRERSAFVSLRDGAHSAKLLELEAVEQGDEGIVEMALPLGAPTMRDHRRLFVATLERFVSTVLRRGGQRWSATLGWTHTLAAARWA